MRNPLSIVNMKGPSIFDFAYQFRLHHTTSTFFTYILNMGQQFFMPIINQQISLLTLTTLKELFTLIALFMDTESQLALAHTCKKVYTCHKEQCKEEIIAFLCDLPNDIPFYHQSCKVFERWLSETGWAAVKVILKKVSTDSLSNSSYPIKALYFDISLQFPNELKCENINTLILISSLWTSSTLESLSFFENLPNLKILQLISTFINDNMVSVISKLSFLKAISLKDCKITDNLSKMFEACTTLEEIELLTCFSATSIVLSPQVKMLYIEGCIQSMKIDLSRCTQLQSL
jgi:hypothetical protein